MKSIESIDKTAKSIGAFDLINYGSRKHHSTETILLRVASDLIGQW